MTVLDQLAEVLEARKSESPESSYVAKLYHKGLDSILKKVGEEATETVHQIHEEATQKVWT